MLIVGAVGVHMALSRLDRRFFNYRKYLSDDSMASLLTMLVCAVSVRRSHPPLAVTLFSSMMPALSDQPALHRP